MRSARRSAACSPCWATSSPRRSRCEAAIHAPRAAARIPAARCWPRPPRCRSTSTRRSPPAASTCASCRSSPSTARTPRTSTTRCTASPTRDGFRLVVAIADVSHYVRPGTPLDDEAQLRATSVYFPGFVVPMLPETLSNGICSLKPKVDRLCFVCDMQIDRDGEVTQSKFYEAVMHSHARLTYTQVWNAVGDDRAAGSARRGAAGRSASLLPQVQRLHQLYQVLAEGARQARRDRIRILAKCASCSARRARSTQAGMLQRNDAHKLIEECMIAANVEAAQLPAEEEDPRAVPRARQAAGAEVRRPAGVPQGIRPEACRRGRRSSRATSPRC